MTRRVLVSTRLQTCGVERENVLQGALEHLTGTCMCLSPCHGGLCSMSCFTQQGF